MAKDAMNNYTATKGNDAAQEVVQLVIDWYRGHRGQLTSTQATNVGTAVTNVLNGTNKV